MKNQITITRRGNGYILSVDGGSIECGTTAEVMSRVGHEIGVSYGKANKELFDKLRTLEADNVKLTEERDKYKSWWAEAYDENRQLKAAICKWFLRAFMEG